MPRSAVGSAEVGGAHSAARRAQDSDAAAVRGGADEDGAAACANDDVIARVLQQQESEALEEEQRELLAALDEEDARALAERYGSDPPEPAWDATRDGSIRTACASLPRQRVQPRPVAAIPALSEAEQAHERLKLRLGMYGLEERAVRGDGNCQFRALADQLYRDEELHPYVRRLAVQQLRAHEEWYAPYVAGEGRPFAAYCAAMARDGEWGDHVTLQAVADAVGAEANLITSYQHNGVVQVQPRVPCGAERAVWLSFWAEVHYNSIYPAGEAPTRPPRASAAAAAADPITAALRKAAQIAEDVFHGRL